MVSGPGLAWLPGHYPFTRHATVHYCVALRQVPFGTQVRVNEQDASGVLFWGFGLQQI